MTFISRVPSRGTVAFAALLMLEAPFAISAQISTSLLRTPNSAERLVAEAIIASSAGGDYVFLPVTANGHRGTLLLDLGTNYYVFLPPALVNSLKLPASGLDSLGIGSAVEYKIPYVTSQYQWPTQPPGLPPTIGLVGTKVLWHYDMLLDGPARRVRLYSPQSRLTNTSTHRSATWFPPGITAKDCMPITIEHAPDDHWVSFSLTVNGHPIPSMFDSGSDVTGINLPAAKIIGIHKSDPQVHLLPPDSADSYLDVGPQHVYAVKGLQLKMGEQALSDHRVYIYQHMPGPNAASPELDVGLDGFRDRLLWISYSTNQVCVSASQAIRHSGISMPLPD